MLQKRNCIIALGVRKKANIKSPENTHLHSHCGLEVSRGTQLLLQRRSGTFRAHSRRRSANIDVAIAGGRGCSGLGAAARARSGRGCLPGASACCC